MPEETQLSLVLERVHGTARWELESSGFGFEAIDEREVQQFRDDAIAAGRAAFDANASASEVLLSLGLLDGEGLPNRGAIALFGHVSELGGRYPTLGCRLVVVDGTVLADEFRDDALVNDNVFGSLRKAMAFCDEHLSWRSRIGNDLHAEIDSEIPRAAVREALANAFGHRDYAVAGLVQVRLFSDRLEVASPGQLHFGLTPADLYVPHVSHPWNPLVLGCLYRRGIVEQLGSGTLRIIRLCADERLGRPAFVAGGASVTCSVPRWGHWLRPDGTSVEVTRIKAAVLSALTGGPAARGELADALMVDPTDVREALVELREMGLVRVKGHGRGAVWLLDTP